jgi:hypothetical protein
VRRLHHRCGCLSSSRRHIDVLLLGQLGWRRGAQTEQTPFIALLLGVTSDCGGGASIILHQC